MHIVKYLTDGRKSESSGMIVLQTSQEVTIPKGVKLATVVVIPENDGDFS